jgi:mercuric ion binding protein
MKHLMTLAILVMTVISTGTSEAAEQTVKLSVPGMHCASCPYMVKKAISRINGIKSVKATMDDRSATVVFDDTLTTAGEIQAATSAIGYDSTVIQGGKGS